MARRTASSLSPTSTGTSWSIEGRGPRAVKSRSANRHGQSSCRACVSYRLTVGDARHRAPQPKRGCPAAPVLYRRATDSARSSGDDCGESVACHGRVSKAWLHLNWSRTQVPRFQKSASFGIDYCCCGIQLLDQACRKAGIPVDEVVDALEMEEEAATLAKQLHDWKSDPRGELIAHIKNTDHKFTREESFILTAPRLL
jgi:uncharacterized protein DUF542